jgi:hypothetical protein
MPRLRLAITLRHVFLGSPVLGPKPTSLVKTAQRRDMSPEDQAQREPVAGCLDSRDEVGSSCDRLRVQPLGPGVGAILCQREAEEDAR